MSPYRKNDNSLQPVLTKEEELIQWLFIVPWKKVSWYNINRTISPTSYKYKKFQLTKGGYIWYKNNLLDFENKNAAKFKQLWDSLENNKEITIIDKAWSEMIDIKTSSNKLEIGF